MKSKNTFEKQIFKDCKVSGEIKKVLLMKIFFEELRLYVRRQGLHSDRYSRDGLRAFLMERAATTDEERAARGPPRNLDQDRQGVEEADQGMWLRTQKGNGIGSGLHRSTLCSIEKIKEEKEKGTERARTTPTTKGDPKEVPLGNAIGVGKRGAKPMIAKTKQQFSKNEVGDANPQMPLRQARQVFVNKQRRNI